LIKWGVSRTLLGIRYHGCMADALNLKEFQKFMLSKISRDPVLHFTFWMSVYSYSEVGDTAIPSLLLH